ncbi:MAG: endonuclease/exonuclease/phosphatase family protein [Candidatus Heimdallarchaeota archaeon]|nr:endonuclease/exonuclease/phosphatase family protein [Candidatus Heimdallarchaeota archaeon]
MFCWDFDDLILAKENSTLLEIDESKYMNYVRIIAPWLFFLSFYRGLVAFFTGFAINHIPNLLALALSFLPPLMLFIPAFRRIEKPLLITSLSWLSAITIPNIWVKMISAFIGLSFSFVSIFQSQKIVANKGYIFLFLYPLDLLIRTPNLGQDLIVHVNPFSLVFGFTLVLNLIYFEFKIQATPKKLRDMGKTGPPRVEYLFHHIAWIFLFLLVLVFLIDFGAAGSLVISRFDKISTAHLFVTSGFIVSGWIATKVQFPNKFILPSFGILLGGSAYLYPWYNFAILSWFIGIIVLQVMTSVLLLFASNSIANNFTGLIVAYYFMSILMFYGLLTESYLLIPLTAVLVGIALLFLPSRLFEKITIPSPRFSYRTKLATMILVLIIFSSTLLNYDRQLETIPRNDNLRLITYNLHFGVDENGLDNSRKIFEEIALLQPSIIVFQEITLASITNGYGDMYSNLKSGMNEMGYAYSYLSSGGKFQGRNLLFSIYPILESTTHQLLPRVIYERTVLEVMINYQGAEIQIFTTHLTHIDTDESSTERLAQIDNLIDIIKLNDKGLPLALLGDFNAEPQWEEIIRIRAILSDAWSLTNPTNPEFTWPNADPQQQIDYIFINSLFQALVCFTHASDTSDHRAVVCDVDIVK